MRLFRTMLSIMGDLGLTEKDYMLIYVDTNYDWLNVYHAMNNHFLRSGFSYHFITLSLFQTPWRTCITLGTPTTRQIERCSAMLEVLSRSSRRQSNWTVRGSITFGRRPATTCTILEFRRRIIWRWFWFWVFISLLSVFISTY